MARRIKILTITPEVILMFAKHGAGKIVDRTVPLDATIVHQDLNGRGDLVLTLESDTFPVVSVLDPVPSLDSPTFRTA